MNTLTPEQIAQNKEEAIQRIKQRDREAEMFTNDPGGSEGGMICDSCA